MEALPEPALGAFGDPHPTPGARARRPFQPHAPTKVPGQSNAGVLNQPNLSFDVTGRRPLRYHQPPNRKRLRGRCLPTNPLDSEHQAHRDSARAYTPSSCSHRGVPITPAPSGCRIPTPADASRSCAEACDTSPASQCRNDGPRPPSPAVPRKDPDDAGHAPRWNRSASAALLERATATATPVHPWAASGRGHQEAAHVLHPPPGPRDAAPAPARGDQSAQHARSAVVPVTRSTPPFPRRIRISPRSRSTSLIRNVRHSISRIPLP